MISDYAVSEIEKMIADGLKPTPADIIRLNALGLKIDHGRIDNALYASRRTATIEGVTLQEPTIAHNLFLGRLADLGFDIDDETTSTICRAWVYSFDVDKLPKLLSREFIHSSICAFVELHFRRVTLTRLKMAVRYVMFGYDSAALERPARPPVDASGRTADDEAEENEWNFALGVIHKGESIGLGISLEEARRHTLAEMAAIVENAIDNQYSLAFGSKAVKAVYERTRLGEFGDTVAEIRARLEKEKNG